MQLSTFIAIGNTGGVGPDVWQAGHSGSLVNLQNTTFSLFTGASQCYPSDCFATNPGRSGADEANNSLGYALFGDNVYDLIYSFAHTGPTFTASFTGSGLQDIFTDESWGIDNLVVDITPLVDGVVPEPATLALLGIGLAGLGALRRRRSPK